MRTPETIVPSRGVLLRAERDVDAGHESLGFLSESHGFLPRTPPPLRLPDSHRAWDDAAEQLPELWRMVSVREALAELPTLDAMELADADVWRASCLLSILAHSFVRVETRPAGDLPASIQRPWDQITQRLGRRRPFLSYNDLIVYNWRFRDAARPDPMRVENLDLLIPTVGNQEERVFYLTQVEIIAQCTPIVGAVVRAQEAVVRDDAAGLKEELLLILERIRHVTEVSFQKIDPNPLSVTYVDPVVWATTVAPFAVPIGEGTAGPSGTAAPIFHLLDTFFGRRGFESFLGREALQLRPWFPPRHQAFLEAVNETPVRDYIRRSDDRVLQGLFSTALDAYAGPRGYLGLHRQKVYGYLELAFKVGRSVTIGGFSGAFRDRAWKDVDEELDTARRERYAEFQRAGHYAVVKSRERVEASVRRVTLDFASAGIPYRPGDHCRVLPENDPELVGRTLAALRAGGRERVPLTREWRDALSIRHAYETSAPTGVALTDFLRYAKLRPLLRPVGKALFALTASAALDRILEARSEDQWELWDVLELLSEEGYETRRLWRSQLWQDEAIARIVPPEPFRTYSVSSAPDGAIPRSLELTVGRLEYRSAGGSVDGVRRRGTASAYVTERAGTDADHDRLMSVHVVRPTRFRLPDDSARPIVMFAGGTGISPFRGFWQARLEGTVGAENWLFFSTPTREHFYYRDELERVIATGKLELRVAFSRDDLIARSEDGVLIVEPEGRARLPDVMEREDTAKALWRLLRSAEEGGAEASVYVCGQAAFAESVTQSLQRIVARFAPGDDAERAQRARGFLRRLVAERRLMQDVFTTYAPHTAPGVAGSGVYDASDLVLHNDDQHGYWFAIDGNVYDVTEFMHLHPGGPTILLESVGLDASREYRAVLHHESSEIDAMLPIYKIGTIRRLDFRSRWGLALAPGEGIVYLPLSDLYRAWVRYLYLLVEMENALRNDFRYLRSALTSGDEAQELNPLKVQYAANTHLRFLEAYFDGSLGADLERLFGLTVGLCAPGDRIDRVGRELARALEAPEAAAMRSFSERARTLYLDVSGRDRRASRAWEEARRLCSRVEEVDRGFLAEMKRVVRDGLRVFEEFEAAAIEQGAETLIASLLGIPDVARRYCTRFTETFVDVG
jgi:sulfite reductase alpha subunit-like flavoprotein